MRQHCNAHQDLTDSRFPLLFSIQTSFSSYSNPSVRVMLSLKQLFLDSSAPIWEHDGIKHVERESEVLINTANHLPPTFWCDTTLLAHFLYMWIAILRWCPTPDDRVLPYKFKKLRIASRTWVVVIANYIPIVYNSSTLRSYIRHHLCTHKTYTFA